jgi:type I restriction enzyme R subunit
MRRNASRAVSPCPRTSSGCSEALVAQATQSGEILDIYAAAGLPKPSLMDLGPEFARRGPGVDEPPPGDRGAAGDADGGGRTGVAVNLVRQRAFSERLAELMNRYTNQQLTAAEVIAELIAMAKEVAARRPGKAFDPPLAAGRVGVLRRGVRERVGA